jgi:Glycosyl hydrolases family 2, TIM barrel domain
MLSRFPLSRFPLSRFLWLAAFFMGLLLFDLRAEAAPVSTTDVDLASRAAWTFQPDGDNIAPKTLPVPYGGWRLNGFPSVTSGTYRRVVSIPKLPGGGEQATLLAFEAVNWEAVVSVGPNAAHLREVATHLSAWTPFTADISRYVTPGQTALLQVHVRDRSHFMDAEGRFTVPAGVEWNDRQARGIIRGVHMQILPAAHIEDVQIVPDTSRQTLTARILLANNSSQTRRLTLAGSFAAAMPGAGWKYPGIPSAAIAIRPGARATVTIGPLKWTPGRASWWWPNVPFRAGYLAQLHRLFLTLHNGTTVAAPVLQVQTTRFGFCTPGQQGNTYTLNGVRINLRGDSLPEGTIGTDAFARLPGFLPPTKTSPGWPGAVRNYQKLNFNVVRMHQVPCTPYMMDVCDELGLLVIPETAIRGGGIKKENITVLPDAFATHLRELILRDRNHPSVFKWSLQNELFGAPEPFMRKLYDTCMQADGMRPCSIDDNAAYPAWPRFAVIEHYSQTGGTPGAAGGSKRTDRPYGQGEYVWPAGNTPPGAVWFGLQTRSLRAQDNADVRPYTLLDVWPGVIPGLTATNFPVPPLPPDSLEQGGRSLIATRSPWLDTRLRLIQRSFAPICAFDADWDAANTPTNGSGFYPSVFPILPAGQSLTRTLTVFNDEFAGTTLQLDVRLLLRPRSKQSVPLTSFKRTCSVPLGGHVTVPVLFTLPPAKDNTALEMQIVVLKGGQERFRESVFYTVQGAQGTQIRYAGRDDNTHGSWQGAYGQEGFLLPMRGGVAQSAEQGIMIRRGTGFEAMTLESVERGNSEGSSAMREWDKTPVVTDLRLPPAGNGLTERHAIAFGGGPSLAMRVDAKDGKPHQVSLYLLDYERKGLAVDIDAFDLQGHPLDTRRVDNYGEGAYVRYTFTGSAVFVLRSLTPNQPPLLTAVFIDPANK